jgi:hypothetical protein
VAAFMSFSRLCYIGLISCLLTAAAGPQRVTAAPVSARQSAADGWRRTADGWQRISHWNVPTPAIRPPAWVTQLDPRLVALLQLLLSIGGLLLFEDMRAVPSGSRFGSPAKEPQPVNR